MKVQYEIKRKPRQKHSYLRFTKGKLVVSTNLTTSLKQIEAFVCSHEAWIEKQRLRYQMREEIKFEFKDGENLQIFGKAVTLKLINNKGISFLDNEKGVLNLYLNKKNKDVSKELLNFCRKALLAYYVEKVSFWANLMNLEYNSILLNNAIKQWAHCTKDGKLVFSLKTIVLNSGLIDYLIVHELSHLVYFNHGKAFYSLVSRYIPDYKEKQEELKTCHSTAVAFVKEED